MPKEGLEPSRPKAQEPKSCVSTSSTTPARRRRLDRRRRRGLTWRTAQTASSRRQPVDVPGGLDVVLRDGDRAGARGIDIDMNVDRMTPSMSLPYSSFSP